MFSRARGAEQHRVLRHQADLRARSATGSTVRDVHAIEQDATCGRIVEAQQQLEQWCSCRRRTARPRPRFRRARCPASKPSSAGAIRVATDNGKSRPRSAVRRELGSGNATGLAGAAMAGCACSSSTRRSIAPAARCTSPHCSISAAAEPETNAAYSRNWPSWPPVISPASTARAPSHSTQRDGGHHQHRADSRQQRAHPIARGWPWRSLLPPPRHSAGSAASSSVKAWMVCMALSVSPARPLESATRSCDARDSCRTLRPTVNSGSRISGNQHHHDAHQPAGWSRPSSPARPPGSAPSAA